MKNVKKYGLLTFLVLLGAWVSLYGSSQEPPAAAGLGMTDEEMEAQAQSQSQNQAPAQVQSSTATPAPQKKVKDAPAALPAEDKADTTAGEASRTVSGGKGQPTKVRIDNADLISNNEDLAPGVQVLTGNVRFFHGNTLMTCDKAEYNRGANTFFASGNVFVNEGDTLTLNSHYMLYTGNEQLIKAYGDVVLVRDSTVLRTDTLNYDRAAEMAYYFDGGTIKDDKNTLTSQIGVYHVSEDKADFYLDVHAHNPDYQMYSDTLYYQTVTKVITVQGSTNIYGNNNKIYTERGAYDTQSGISDFYWNNRISYGRRMLRADTLHYERNEGYARAMSNVEIQDSVQQSAVYGDFAEYFERQDSIIFPRNPKAVQLLEKDTLFTRSDTMMVTRRSSLVAYLAAKKAGEQSSDDDGQEERQRILSDLPDMFGRMKRTAADTTATADEDTATDSLVAGSSETIDTLATAEAVDSLANLSPRALKKAEKARQRAEKQRLKEEKRRIREEKREAKLRAETGEKEPSDTLERMDSLLVVADSLLAGKDMLPVDSSGVVVPGDSLSAGIDAPDTLSWNRESDDSLRVMRAFHQVRFFKRDMAGVADSVFYDQKTGIMSLFKDPAIFSGDNQVTADSIHVKRDLERNVLDSIILVKNAFILSRDARDPGAYNQVRGNTMRGKIIDNDLRVVNVIGNAQTIYYSYDSQGKSVGVNHSDASKMKVFMKASQVQRIRFEKDPSGTMFSDGKNAPEESRQLKGFLIREDERPMAPEDIWGGHFTLELDFGGKKSPQPEEFAPAYSQEAVLQEDEEEIQ